jgi:hypothetical protein
MKASLTVLLLILSFSSVWGSPLREFLSGTRLIVVGKKDVHVTNDVIRRLEPILVDSMDRMIVCKQTPQCDPETQIDDLYRIIFVVHECCEPDLRMYIRKAYKLSRDVWKPLIGHIRFSSSNPRNYISTGIQFGDLIYNLYHS